MKTEIKDNALRQYLSFEKTLRKFFSDSMDCKNRCGEKFNCCNDFDGKHRGMGSFANMWDRYVISKTFPEWIDYEKNRKKDRCPYLSDTGCVIPSGRPTICTVFVCSDYKGILGPGEEKILQGYTMISLYMSEVLRQQVAGSADVMLVKKVDNLFKTAEEAIQNSDRFTEKFHYSSIIS